jgi:hypothetical protein
MRKSAQWVPSAVLAGLVVVQRERALIPGQELLPEQPKPEQPEPEQPGLQRQEMGKRKVSRHSAQVAA